MTTRATRTDPVIDLGLLLDIDGPIASPVTRTIAIPSILDDLVRLTRAGVPIAFITGRSEQFVRDAVLTPLNAVGLSEALAVPGARMFAVFEKGGAWAPITAEGMDAPTVDASVAFDQAIVEAVRELAERDFADTMFFDDTKRAMISVEQRTDVEPTEYRPAQSRFTAAVFDLLARRGLGIRLGDAERPDVSGAVPYRIEPTVISTDIESVRLDKDHGAQRALEYFGALGELPTRWRSVGDSRGDYLMADYLSASGYDTAHVDVRPGDGILDRPYPVLTADERIHDEAGAAFLRGWVNELTA